MSTRVGKIARLPRAIREQLNERLDEGAQAPELLDWLNGLDEVKALLAREFDGKPVSPQNLSKWRQGGYEDWLVHNEAVELAGRLQEEAVDLNGEERPKRSLAELMMTWLTARYAVAVRQLGKPDQEGQWDKLRELCADLTRIRKIEQSQRRLELEELRAVERASEKVAHLKKLYEPVDHAELNERIERIRFQLFGEAALSEEQCRARRAEKAAGNPGNPSQSNQINPSGEARNANDECPESNQNPARPSMAPTTAGSGESSPIKADQTMRNDEPEQTGRAGEKAMAAP
ncbi:MAG TPA: hypothetical protein VHH73_08355 [Verrucomicrobiae bacterium]|nr:hypothetical protein [Verrucomicrobiae bacterium]